jgi:hypothetical protein
MQKPLVVKNLPIDKCELWFSFFLFSFSIMQNICNTDTSDWRRVWCQTYNFLKLLSVCHNVTMWVSCLCFIVQNVQFIAPDMKSMSLSKSNLQLLYYVVSFYAFSSTI